MLLIYDHNISILVDDVVLGSPGWGGGEGVQAFMICQCTLVGLLL